MTLYTGRYRVVRTKDGTLDIRESLEVLERTTIPVHLDEEAEVMGGYTSVEQLRHDLEQMLEALDMPVLEATGDAIDRYKVVS